jgi:hypothetical protein
MLTGPRKKKYCAQVEFVKTFCREERKFLRHLFSQNPLDHGTFVSFLVLIYVILHLPSERYTYVSGEELYTGEIVINGTVKSKFYSKLIDFHRLRYWMLRA